jgi:L-threonylcarbamoyladenylate synthase
MDEIIQACRVLKQGGVVVFPTATCYGLAVDANNVQAVKKLYELKGRDFNKPVHVMVQNIKNAKQLVRFSPVAERIAQAHWPGPITLVLPLVAQSLGLRFLAAKTGRLGVRLPDHAKAKQLVDAFGGPITATSANKSGSVNPYTKTDVLKEFKQSPRQPDYVLDAGRLNFTGPSTVVQVDGPHVKLIRSGPVKIEDLIHGF